MSKSVVENIPKHYNDRVNSIEVKVRNNNFEPVENVCGFKSAIISQYNSPESVIRNFVSRLRKLDSNVNLSVEVNNSFNPSDLYKNASTMEDIIRNFVNYLEENKESGREYSIIKYLSYLINIYKERLSQSEYLNDPLIKDIDEQSISNMEVYFNRCVELYKERKSGEVNKDYAINPYSTDIESKLNKSRLIRVIDKLVSIVNEAEGKMRRGIGVKVNEEENTFSLEIDPRTIVDGTSNLTTAINLLCIKIKTIMNSNSLYASYIIDVFVNDLSNLLGDYIKELNKSIYVPINGEIIEKLVLTINGGNMYDANRSVNHLSLEGLVSVDNFELDKLFNTSNQSTKAYQGDVIPYVLKGIEQNMSENKDVKLNTDIFTNLKNYIKMRSKVISNISNSELELYRSEINNYLILVSYYNDLVSRITSEGKMYEQRRFYAPIDLERVIVRGVKYIYLSEINGVISNIVKNNPDDFDINEYPRYRSTSYYWRYNNGDGVREYSNSYLGALIKYTEDYREDALKRIYSKATPVETITLKRAYTTKYNLHFCMSPASMNLSDSLDLITNSDLIPNNKITIINTTNDVNIHYKRYISFLGSVSQYDDNIHPETINVNEKNINPRSVCNDIYSLSGLYSKIVKDMRLLMKEDSSKFNEKTKELIDLSVQELNSYIHNMRFTISQMVGRETHEYFEEFTDMYLETIDNAKTLSNFNIEIGNPTTIDLIKSEYARDPLVVKIREIHQRMYNNDYISDHKLKNLNLKPREKDEEEEEDRNMKRSLQSNSGVSKDFLKEFRKDLPKDIKKFNLKKFQSKYSKKSKEMIEELNESMASITNI
jgi:hypothetical protein